MAKKVILDTDPAIGYAFKDVDDALALLHLVAHPQEIDLLGVTTVFGNASGKRTFRKALEILEVIDRRDIPAYKGASLPWRRGEGTEASTFLTETIDSLPGEVTLLAIGPLTNIATALLKNDGFVEKLERLVILGGIMPEGKRIRFMNPFDLNFFADPPSAHIVMSSEGDKTLIPVTLCHKVVFTARELSRLEDMDNRLSRYLLPSIEPWFKLNLKIPFLPWRGGFVPWDVIATSVIVIPEAFSDMEMMQLDVKPRGLARGRVFPDISRQVPPTQVPTDVDSEAVLRSLLDSLGSFD